MPVVAWLAALLAAAALCAVACWLVVLLAWLPAGLRVAACRLC